VNSAIYTNSQKINW